MKKSQVPFFRPDIGEHEISEVVETLRSGWLTSGKRVQLFEKNFAEAVGASHAVALNSCTAALHLAVEALGLKAGQGVLVPTMTFAATAEVVRYLGAVPILVDCDPVTLNLDLNDAESKVQSAKGKATEIVGIMPVHVGGMMMDVAAIRELARSHKLWIVEDAAHAFPAAVRQGAKSEGRAAKSNGERARSNGQGAGIGDWRSRVGEQNAEVQAGHSSQITHRSVISNQHIAISTQQSAINTYDSSLSTCHQSFVTDHPESEWQRCGEGTADVTCFSFYANKTITTGEGGMAVTENEEIAQRMRVMSLHGLSQDAWERYSGGSSWDYKIVAPGYKYNLTDIAAAIGIHQLARAEEMRCEREAIARFYLEAFAETEEIELPPEDPNLVHAWHLFPIKLRLERLSIDRNDFIRELRVAGIGCSVHWRPLHLHPYYQETYGWRAEEFPVATNVWQRLISLPIFPGMRAEEIEYVVETVKGIASRSFEFQV